MLGIQVSVFWDVIHTLTAVYASGADVLVMFCFCVLGHLRHKATDNVSGLIYWL